ncbi:serine hydrolase [Sulfobacillus harzensis]|uniref:Serine hydrolase n=1 Tax=Sulfobacillus harzensis TaxID=2729629 RepID=A0A7Y0Q3G2_9FIRM|nr:serine hydrolase [Sulfobacillus harzensis]NMP24213.1 serine hydrolase [Sulfobacillus harzensis]
MVPATPQSRRSKTVPPRQPPFRFSLVAAGALAVLGGAFSLWMLHNQRHQALQASTITQTLRQDHALGVPTSAIRPLSQELAHIQHARILFIPSLYLGGLTRAPEELSHLRAVSAHLLSQNTRYERRIALQWASRLIHTEGRFATVNETQAAQSIAHAPLSRVIRTSEAWRAQYRDWQHALHELSTIAGGLSHGRPNQVSRELDALDARLSSVGPYWNGVAQARSASTEAKAYLNLPPPQEVAQYHQISRTLRQALAGLEPPTTTELSHILSQIGGGLVNHQPRDVTEALSSLEDKLQQANAAWTGYGAAQAAVDTASQYLKGPLVSEIREHPAVLDQLQAALRGLTPPAPPLQSGNPFGAAFQQYLAGRLSEVSVAVYNANTGITSTYNPGIRYDTASIVKATIMATLLWQAERAGRPLTADAQALMVPMIEQSSNSAATLLWNAAGGASGIGQFLDQAGMANTIPGEGGYWGLTLTTPLDQVKLLKLLSYPNPLLDAASQAYAANLMDNVVSFEDWGVSTGPVPGSTVALKNGWLPIGSNGWEINSIGHVSGDGRNYVVAILSRNNPTESYGIQTVDAVSQFIWNAE